MEERDYYIILYDLYSSLFSMKQREYFEDYYFNNLSLSAVSFTNVFLKKYTYLFT